MPLATILALLDVKVSVTATLLADVVSMLLVIVADVIITLQGGYYHHALSSVSSRRSYRQSADEQNAPTTGCDSEIR